MFDVRENVTFILDNNITLRGHNQNTGAVVNVNGGIFKMNAGASIADNILGACCCHRGAGVRVSSGTFEMTGGTISGNTNGNAGGGVYNAGTFNITGGNISGNNANYGGGVNNDGTFNMRGGTISNNTATRNGGGVNNGGTFTMGNGNITGNTAGQNGGGINAGWGFTKTGGTITGHTTDQNNGNVVRDDGGVLARRGHAVWVNENRRRERTAGTDIRMNSNTDGTAGGWEN
jgi:hypothetical protein